MFHSINSVVASHQQFVSQMRSISTNEKKAQNDYTYSIQMIRFKNMRKEHEPGIKFVNEIPSKAEYKVQKFW